MSKTYLHSGARGDIIYGLPVIKLLGGGILYVNISCVQYRSRLIIDRDIDWFRELLVGQVGIEDVRKWEPGVTIDYDLDDFRKQSLFGLLSIAHLKAFNLDFDLSQQWFDPAKVLPAPKGGSDIVINRSRRYHGVLAWDELEPWQDRCLFVGLEDEHAEFVQFTGLTGIRYHGECSYRDLAGLIAGSKLFVGNQSFPYALAEAMKVPRVLEVFPPVPNCMPQSENGMTRLTQNVLKAFVNGTPYVREPSMSFCQPIVGHKAKGVNFSPKPVITFIVVHAGPDLTPFVAKAVHRDKFEVLWDDRPGDCRAAVNRIATQAQGRIICVVDMAWTKDYMAARKIADLLENFDGLAGMYAPGDSLEMSGACFAVSRKAYEQCGLFNLALIPGSHNFIEIAKKYAKCGYSFRSAGLDKSGA